MNGLERDDILPMHKAELRIAGEDKFLSNPFVKKCYVTKVLQQDMHT